jgi:hypothetical protein
MSEREGAATPAREGIRRPPGAERLLGVDREACNLRGSNDLAGAPAKARPRMMLIDVVERGRRRAAPDGTSVRTSPELRSDAARC